MSEETPLISICLATYNDCSDGHLQLMMKSIFDFCGDIPIEVCVVDNNSKDNTQEFLEQCVNNKKYKGRVKHAKNAINESILAVNNAVGMSSGKYIMDIAADMVLAPDTLKNMFTKLQRLEEINMGWATVSGMLIEPIGDCSGGLFCAGDVGVSPEEFDYAGWERKAHTYTIKQKKERDREYWTIPLLMSRDVWNAVGGLCIDYLFPAAWADMDFANKILNRKGYMVCCADAPVYHFVSSTFKRNMQEAGYSDVARNNHKENKLIYERKWPGAGWPLNSKPHKDWDIIKARAKEPVPMQKVKDEKKTIESEVTVQDVPTAPKKKRGRKKGSKNQKAKPHKRGGKSTKPTIETGKPGRPLTAKEEVQHIEVDGDTVPVKVITPESSDIKLEIRGIPKNPPMPQKNLDCFDDDYYSESQYGVHNILHHIHNEVQAQYVLHYLKIKKILVCGCADGEELIAYNTHGVENVGQELDIEAVRDIAYPEIKDKIQYGEIYKIIDKNQDCETIQLFNVLQYMPDEVYNAVVDYIVDEALHIKQMAILFHNKKYELQVCNQFQEQFDLRVAEKFDIVNTEDDFKYRTEDLARLECKIYGLDQAEKLIWLYKRK